MASKMITLKVFLALPGEIDYTHTRNPLRLTRARLTDFGCTQVWASARSYLHKEQSRYLLHDKTFPAAMEAARIIRMVTGGTSGSQAAMMGQSLELTDIEMNLNWNLHRNMFKAIEEIARRFTSGSPTPNPSVTIVLKPETDLRPFLGSGHVRPQPGDIVSLTVRYYPDSGHKIVIRQGHDAPKVLRCPDPDTRPRADGVMHEAMTHRVGAASEAVASPLVSRIPAGSPAGQRLRVRSRSPRR